MVVNLVDKEGTKSGKGFNFSLFGLNDGISKKEVSALNEINKQIESGVAPSKALGNEWLNLSKSNQELLRGLVKSGKSSEEISAGFANAAQNANKLGISSKIAAVGMQALSMAANMLITMGISFAIQRIITAITNIAQASEKAAEKTREATSTYKDSLSSLDDYKTKVAELQEALSSGDLSYDETKDKRLELMEIQSTLIENFRGEAGAIDLVTEAINGQSGAWDKLSGLEYEKWLRKANEKDYWTGKSGLDYAKEYMENDQKFSFGISNAGTEHASMDYATEYSKVQEELLKSFPDLLKNGSFNSAMQYELTADPVEAKEALVAIKDKYKEIIYDVFKDTALTNSQIEDLFSQSLSGIDEQLNTIDEGLTQHQDNYKTYLDGYIKYNSEFSDEYKSIVEEKAKYDDAMAKNDNDAIKTSELNFKMVYRDIMSKTKNNPNIQNYFKNLFPDLSNQIKNWEFKDKLELPLNVDGFTLSKSLKGLKDTDLLDQIFNNDISPEFQAVIDQADRMHIITDQSAESLVKLVDILGELGVVTSTVSKEVESINKSFDSVKASVENAQNAILTVNETLNAQNTGVGITLDQYESLIAVNEDYAECLEYNNGVMQINAEKAKAITDIDVAKQIQNTSTQLKIAATQYNNNNDKLQQLQNEYNKLSDAESKEKAAKLSEIDALESSQTALSANIKKYSILVAKLKETNGAYQEWKNAQNAGESGDMFTDLESAKDQIVDGQETGRIGTKKYQVAWELLIPDTVDPKDGEAVNNYIEKLKSYMTVDDDGNKTFSGLDNFLTDAMDNDLMNEAENGMIKVAEGINMQDFCDKLELTPEMVRGIFGELEEYGGKFDWSDEFGDSLQLTEEEIQRYTSNINDEIRTINESQIAPEVKGEQLETLYGELYDIKHLKDGLGEITDVTVKANIEVTDQLQQAKQELEEAKAQAEENGIEVDADVNVQNAEEKVAELELQLSLLNKPTEAQINVSISEANSAIAGLKQDLETLESDPTNTEIVVKVGAGSVEDAKSIIEGQLSDLNNLKAKLTLLADGSSVKASLDDVEKRAKEIASGKYEASITANITNFKNGIDEANLYAETLNDKTVYVTTVNRIIDESARRTGGEQAQINGTAHSNGTAFEGGDWSAKSGGKTLVGELGREIVVFWLPPCIVIYMKNFI